MCYKFFRVWSIEEEIAELNLIAPHFVAGHIESVIDLYFRINKSISASGLYLYQKYKLILIEAESIILSDNFYNYNDYRDRVLLNYAIGFMKLELKKQAKNNV